MTAPEPVTGATQDPRIPAVTRALHDDSVPGCPMVDCEVGHAYYGKVAAVAIAAADAADAAAGIRRVTLDEAIDRAAKEHYNRTWGDFSHVSWADAGAEKQKRSRDAVRPVLIAAMGDRS